MNTVRDLPLARLSRGIAVGTLRRVASQYLSIRPNLEVADVSASVAFYAETLGLEVRVAMGDPPAFAILGNDTAELALVAARRPAIPVAASCYVNVVGVDAIYEHCLERGVTITHKLATHPWGMTDFVLRDPDGHQVAVGEQRA